MPEGRPTPPVPSARATLSKLQGESGQLADDFKSAQDQKAAIAIIALQGQFREMEQHLSALRNAKRDRQPLRTRDEPLSPSFEGAAWTLTEMVLPAVQKVREGASTPNKANQRSRH